jgi:hypothetical protein
MMTLVLADGGELTWNPDPARIMPVGDRGLPKTVIYRHSGDKKQPALEIEIEVRKGIPVIAKVTFTAPPEGTTGVRGVKLGTRDIDRSVSYWLAEVAYQPNKGGRPGHSWVKDYPVSAAERRAAARAVERATRQTRRRMSDEELRRVAEMYQGADPPKHMAIAKAFIVTPRTAQRYIEKAREAGFLPPSERARKQ